MSVEAIEKTFSCPDNPQLRLDNIRGSVRIQAGESGIISVVARKHLKTGDGENTRIELSQAEDGTVRVSTHYEYKELWLFRRWVPCKVDYEIRVPEECSLKVRGVSSSAVIEGIKGNHDISSVNGDVELRSMAGEFTIRMVSGDLRGENLSGPIRLQTVSGDLKIIESNIPNMTGKTVSGDLSVESPVGDGVHSFNAISGDIRLFLPTGRGATITSSSLSGKIRNSLNASQSSSSSKEHFIEIEGGGMKINHSSVSGDLLLVGDEHQGTRSASEESHQGEGPVQSRSDILERVNRGEMSVDQAVELLAGEAA